MSTLVSIIIVVFSILQIVLFFKLWGMTNDVSEMKSAILRHLEHLRADRMEANSDSGTAAVQTKKMAGNISVGDLVVELGSERQLKVKDITKDGKFLCNVAGLDREAGIFERKDIELFSVYWGKGLR